ncbi:hypothetical protein FNN36_21585 [Salmonella enterica]|uniref:SimA domain protein n=5 Tax=Salmonella enterica TaxID=28901 RepID=A0A5Y8DY14_SALER|nr:hypothetical protein [Salmonella enterica]EBU8789213.1 hypothetical protein [Salmonella enterica subsp. enterica serovar Newport]ECG1401225.1 hypothetical protein [Salmonella enterica subsp. enterica serovar Panama str. CFSAN000601]EDE1737719.1 hypothetical protein [Salmonella enterica subsp. enterica serovar Montevideo]EDE1889267.1 hypothetical protein [Salmonella enterica subsp. enterica serovar Enteritidis]EDF3739351.1 hypothetical protein [Salmonella enterica subsp. enterica serovar Typ
MKKLALALCFVAGTANAASSLKQICTDYTKYLGHVYGFAVSEDESMRKLLLADMKRLNLSEAMVPKEMYKATTDDAAKMYYSMFLNPDLNETNKGAFAQMVSYCEAGPDVMIPSWPVLVANGKVRKEDAGSSFMETINSDKFKNAPGMRHQPSRNTPEFKSCVAQKLAEEKRANPSVSQSALEVAAEAQCLNGNSSVNTSSTSTGAQSLKIKRCTYDKFYAMKKDSPNVPEANLMATAKSLCEDGY